MRGDSGPEAPRRARQAFVLGWAVTNLGGVNEVVRNLIREFAAAGPLAPLVIEAGRDCSPRTIAPDVPVLALDFLPPYDPNKPFRVTLRFLFYLLPCLWRLVAICRKYDVKVLNPHFTGLQYFILALFRRSGLFRGKLLFSFHGADVRVMMLSRGTERLLYRWLLRGADVLIPCSAGLGEELAMFVPECADRISPVHNGIDANRFLSSADPVFQLPVAFRDRTKLLNIGAFEYKKGQENLIKAFARLRVRHPDICLIIAGQRGHRVTELRNLIHELGLEDDVLLLIDLPHAQVSTLMQQTDIFVLSSRWEKGICGEGFAMVLLEAGAAGVPVVSTESCGVNELLSNRESGIIVPTNRPDLLAHAIEVFLDDPREAAREAANLHNIVRRQFTWTAAHQRYVDLVTDRRPNAAPEVSDASVTA
jgi:glycosyltransferase involved in cell wall biosynthesis